MKLMVLILSLSPAMASAEFCASHFEGKWKCDMDIFGDEIAIKVIPWGHGLQGGMIAIVNPKDNVTQMSSPLDYQWTTDPSYYAVRGRCVGGKDSIEIEFKGREIGFQRTDGKIILEFEEGRENDRDLTMTEFIPKGWEHRADCKPVK